MSTTETVEPTRSQIRAAYNPFDHGCWQDFLNKLTQGYMSLEPDPWYPVADFHGQWFRHFESPGDNILMCQRDGLKTTVTLAYLIAHLEYNDGFRALWVTNNQTQAFKKADTELNRMIRRNPWLTNLNAEREEDSKQGKIFANGSILYSGWLFGGIEGDRAHLMVLDDLIKEQGDGDTQKIDEYIGTLVPIVKDGGRTVIIGTRKQTDDIYSVLQSRDGYSLTEYPAVLDFWDDAHEGDDDWAERRPDERFYTECPNPFNRGGETVHVLWPEARGPEFLFDKRGKQGRHQFYREYCLALIGGSGDLVNDEILNRSIHSDEGPGCSIRGKTPPVEVTAQKGEQIVVGFDPAQSPTGDNAAFVVMHIQQGPNGAMRTLLDAHAETGMSPAEIQGRLTSLNDRFDPSVIVIESNGMQQYIVNDALSLGPDMAAKVRGKATTGKKHSWENGIPRLQTLIETGSFQFYRGHDPTEQFVNAVQSLELENGRLKGHTPDLVAAWYVAESAIGASTGNGDGSTWYDPN